MTTRSLIFSILLIATLGVVAIAAVPRWRERFGVVVLAIATAGLAAVPVATRSGGKLRELRPLFAAHSIAVIDLADAGLAESSEEDGLEVFETFEENALAKARYFTRGRSDPPSRMIRDWPSLHSTVARV